MNSIVSFFVDPNAFKGLIFSAFIIAMVVYFATHKDSSIVADFSKSFGFASAISGLIPVLYIVLSYFYVDARVFLDGVLGDTAYLVSAAVALYFAYRQIIHLIDVRKKKISHRRNVIE